MNLKFHFTSKLISCSKTSPLGVTNGTLSNLEKKDSKSNITHTLLSLWVHFIQLILKNKPDDVILDDYLSITGF